MVTVRDPSAIAPKKEATTRRAMRSLPTALPAESGNPERRAGARSRPRFDTANGRRDGFAGQGVAAVHEAVEAGALPLLAVHLMGHQNGLALEALGRRAILLESGPVEHRSEGRKREGCVLADPPGASRAWSIVHAGARALQECIPLLTTQARRVPVRHAEECHARLGQELIRLVEGSRRLLVLGILCLGQATANRVGEFALGEPAVVGRPHIELDMNRAAKARGRIQRVLDRLAREALLPRAAEVGDARVVVAVGDAAASRREPPADLTTAHWFAPRARLRTPCRPSAPVPHTPRSPAACTVPPRASR